MPKDSDLDAPGLTKPWTLPPEPKPPDNLPPLPPVPGLPRLEPLPPDPQPGAPSGPRTFDDFASRMGREIVKVSPIFRIGAVLVLAGALVLCAENAMIFTGTMSQIQHAQDFLQNSQNSSAANGTGGILAGMQGYFAMLSFATTLDLAGYAMLGIGAMLIGIGSTGIVFRHRFDGEERRPSKSIMILGLISGAFALAWVMYTTQWRTALTGSATGDWSLFPPMFDVANWVQARSVPPSVTDFADSFPRASQSWIYAGVVQVPAALFFFLMGWRLKKETGIRIGGTSWLVFSITSLIGLVIAIAATIGALHAAGNIDFNDPNSWGEAISSVGLQLAVAAGIKLFFIPLWGMIAFAVLSISGFKLMMIKPGKITMSDKLLKQILKAQPAPSMAAPSAPGGTMGELGPPASGQAATSTSLPSPSKKGEDVVVSLSGPIPPPPPPPGAAPPWPPPPP